MAHKKNQNLGDIIGSDFFIEAIHKIIDEKGPPTKSRPVLVFYISTEGCGDTQGQQIVHQIAETFNRDDIISHEEYAKIFVPIPKGHSRVECLNPVELSTEDKDTFWERVTTIQKHFYKFLESQKYESQKDGAGE